MADEKTTDEQVKEAIAEVKSEGDKAVEEVKEEAKKASDEAKEEKEEKKEEATEEKAIDEEKLTEMAVRHLRSLGADVRLSGEVEGEKEVAREEVKVKTAQEYLRESAVTDAEVPGFSSMEIEDQLRVTPMVISARNEEQTEKRAQEIAAEQIAPLKEELQRQAFRSEALGIGSELAREAGDEGAAQEIAVFVEQVGPGYQEAVQQSPLFADLIKTKAQAIVAKRSGKREDEEQVKMPKAENVGGSVEDSFATNGEQKAFDEAGLPDGLKLSDLMTETKKELA